MYIYIYIYTVYSICMLILPTCYFSLSRVYSIYVCHAIIGRETDHGQYFYEHMIHTLHYIGTCLYFFFVIRTTIVTAGGPSRLFFFIIITACCYLATVTGGILWSLECSLVATTARNIF